MGDYHRMEEQVSLILSSSDSSLLPELERKFVRVSCLATVTHLKKFLALKVLKEEAGEEEDKFRDIDITCEGELIPKDHTLKFIYVTRWRTKDPPLHLVYSPKIDLETETGAGKETDIPEWK